MHINHVILQLTFDTESGRANFTNKISNSGVSLEMFSEWCTEDETFVASWEVANVFSFTMLLQMQTQIVFSGKKFAANMTWHVLLAVLGLFVERQRRFGGTRFAAPVKKKNYSKFLRTSFALTSRTIFVASFYNVLACVGRVLLHQGMSFHIDCMSRSACHLSCHRNACPKISNIQIIFLSLQLQLHLNLPCEFSFVPCRYSKSCTQRR